MTVKGIELNFDLTSPADMVRYKDAGTRMTEEGQNVPAPTVDATDPKYLDEYIAMLNGLLCLYGNFLDEVFGDGIATQLLSDNPSLNRLLDVDEALEEAFGGQGKAFGARMTTRFDKYTPNRATRRAKK